MCRMRIFLSLMLKFFLMMMVLALAFTGYGQQVDSIAVPPDTGLQRPVVTQPARRVVRTQPQPDVSISDSALPSFRTDTIALASGFRGWSRLEDRISTHPYFRFTNPGRYTVSIRQWTGKEAIFYALIALLIFFAVIRNGFSRYINDLFKTFFRTTIRQRQIKEQLLQSPLPSLLLNVFFVLSVSLFAALALQHFALGTHYPFWLLYGYCLGALTLIYFGKFLVMKFIGWLLGSREAADTYIFVIFSANKIMGIALLPVLLVLGFNQGVISQVAITLGLVIVIGLFAYRFFLSFVSIQRQMAISFFHFALYLAAFEVVPLLLINKALLRFLQ
jgi:hypothetical protein